MKSLNDLFIDKKNTQQNKLTLAGNHEYKETDSIQSHSLWVTLYLAQEKKLFLICTPPHSPSQLVTVHVPECI